MFQQVLAPIGHSVALSFSVAATPILLTLTLLGPLRRPAWQASAIGLIAGLVIATVLWGLPVGLALRSISAGMAFALWPVMWIVFNTLLLFNLTVHSGSFTEFRNWLIHNLPNDRRVILVVVGFSFGALLEGIAGGGTPVAITSALLVALGFSPIDALTYTLIFNTAPVAFGALGIPITVLSSVTGLPDTALAAMVGRQVPIFALILPLYAVVLYSSWRAALSVWPLLLMSGGTFAAMQFLASNFLNYPLTDVLSSLVSLAATIGFSKIWRPPHDPAHSIAPPANDDVFPGAALRGWLPWLMVSGVVILWTVAAIPSNGTLNIPVPGLHDEVFITLYGKAYPAVWSFQPLATGTAILVATALTALISRTSLASLLKAIATTWIQIRLVTMTVTSIIGLAYLMNYSGLTYTLGLGIASVGPAFPFVSAFLGWVAVLISGSDASGNALFGNLQVVAAHQLNLNPILMAATNSTGGVMGKMISPQNISTGVSTTNLIGREGEVFARTYKHSVALTVLLGIIVYLQQTSLSFMIPSH